MWESTTYNTTKVTVELRELVENGVNIWDFEYPSFYTGEDKKAFEKKVIDHYYFRQIGQETVGRFLHYFRSKICEIMPHYIRMYESVKLMDDLDNPFDNVDVVETYKETSTGKTEGVSSATSNSKEKSTKKTVEDKKHRFSNTPQNSIDNLDRYMTEASIDNNNIDDDIDTNIDGSSAGESTTETTGTVEHTFSKKGNQGINTYAHDIIEFRQALINVDMMIINELNSLFLGVY